MQERVDAWSFGSTRVVRGEEGVAQVWILTWCTMHHFANTLGNCDFCSFTRLTVTTLTKPAQTHKKPRKTQASAEVVIG